MDNLPTCHICKKDGSVTIKMDEVLEAVRTSPSPAVIMGVEVGDRICCYTCFHALLDEHGIKWPLQVTEEFVLEFYEKMGYPVEKGCPNCDGVGRDSCPMCSGTNRPFPEEKSPTDLANERTRDGYAEG